MARASLSNDKLESMRRRLAEAALSIYKADGVDAVTFRRLAEAVGISHTLPYRYIENKDALLARVRTDCFGCFEDFVRSREVSTEGLSTHIRSVAHAYVDFARQHPREYRLMFSTDQPSPDRYPELLAARRSLFEHAVDVAQRYIDAGELSGEARMVAHALWIGLHGLMTLHVANQLVHGYRLEELVEPLIERMLAPRPAADKGSRERSTPKPARAATLAQPGRRARKS